MHLICGETLYDLLIGDQPPTDDAYVPLQAMAGGSPFNVAIGMARLGVPIALATDIARDGLGNRLAERVRAEGIADQFIRRTAPATALAMVATDRGPPIYSFVGFEGATYAPDEQAVERFGRDLTGLHMGSIALVLDRSAQPLAELAKRLSNRMMVSLDPNVRLSIEPNTNKWRAAIDRIRSYAHVIKISDEDMAALYPDALPEDVCNEWLSEVTSLVVLTRGSDGATMFARETGRVEVAPFDIRLADTVGAGDSFMAGLLTALMRERHAMPARIGAMTPERLHQAGRFAAAAASITCSRRGPILPRLHEVEAIAPLPAATAD